MKTIQQTLTRIVLICTILIIVLKVNAQTTLQQGDVSIIGWGSNISPSDDRSIGLLTWVPLSTGTVIKFTTNGFKSNTVGSTATNNAYTLGGQVMSFTVISPISPGSVIKIVGLLNSSGTTPTVTCTTGSGSVALAASGAGGNGSSFALSSVGRAIFIYQGADWDATASTATFFGNLLYGLTYRGGDLWLTSGTASTSRSYKPADLPTTGSFGNLALDGFNPSARWGYYSGATSGFASISDAKNAVNNAANWTSNTSSSTIANTSFISGFTVPNISPSFTSAVNTLSVCKNSTATSINSLLTVSDNDASQTETWSVSTAPTRGTLSGFNAFAGSGFSVTPTGLTYTPTSGYSGTDAFTIAVSDDYGGFTTKTITVTVNPLPTATITGTATVVQNSTAPSVTFTGALGTAPYTFTYNINGGTNTTVTTISGNSIVVTAPTGTAGVFVYNLVSVSDASATTCSQTQTGSAIINVTAIPPGNALDFDVVNDYVDLGYNLNNYFAGKNQITIETWVNIPQYDVFSTPIGNYNGNSNTMQFMLRIQNGIPNFWVQRNSSVPGGYMSVSAGSQIPLSKWVHIACTWDGSALRIYSNGVLAGTTTGVTGIFQTHSLYSLKLNSTYGEKFKGKMDEVKIWDAARTQAQIQLDMLNIASSGTTNLKAYYNFDAGVAAGNNTGLNTLYDQSGNAFDGALNNFALTTALGATSNWVESYAMVVPTTTAATSVIATSFTANWTAPTVGTVTNYLLDVSTSSNFASFVSGYNALSVSGTSKSVTGLTAGTTYHYRVRADKTSVTGQGGYSANTTVATCVNTTSTTNVSICPSELPYSWNGTAYNAAGTYTKTFTNAVGCDSLASLVLTVNTTTRNALAFDGSDYVATNSTLGISGTGSFTVEAWVKTTATSGGAIIAKRKATSNGNFFGLLISGAGKPYFEINESSSANYTIITGNTSVNDGAWHHIAAVRTATQILIYVDGISDATAVTILGNPNLNTTTFCTLGTLLDNAGTGLFGVYTGSMDEVRLWNTVRSQTDLQANMNNELVGNETGLTAYYNFNQGTANGTNTGVTTLLDRTVNNRNGTLTNFTLSGNTSNWVMNSKVFASITNATICSSALPYSWNGLTFTTAGTRTASLTNANGCDSLATLVLTVKATSTSTTNTTICSSQLPYSWNGNRASAGTYTYTTPNSVGCDSVATLNLTVNQSPVIASLGNALYFSNASYNVNYVSFNSSFNTATNYSTASNFTIESWINPSDNGFRSFFSHKTSGGNADGYALFVNPSGYANKLYLEVANNGFLSTGSLTAGQWNHVALVYAAGIATWYINGVASGSATINITTNGGATLLGVLNGGNYEFNGGMDEVRIWNTVRTQAEIAANMNKELAGNEAGLYAYYNFNQGIAGGNNSAVTTLFDKTANTNNGTLNLFSLSGSTSNFVSSYSASTQSVCLGSSATSFSPTVTGATSYQWYSNTTASNTGGSIIGAAASASYTAPTTIAGTTYYYLVANNAFGCGATTSSVQTVTVKATSSSITNVSICPSELPYSWNGIRASAGTYTYTTTNSQGCDSVATLNLTVKTTSTSTTDVSICSSTLPYDWNGSRASAGTYTFTTTNSQGCDSVATLNLTINSTTTSTNTASVCSNQLPYSWNGLTFTTAGSLTATLTNAAGCDSLATLDLTIKNTYYYSITNSAGGLTGPGTNVAICEGNNMQLWFYPNSGYHVASVYLDGIKENVPPYSYSYTFPNPVTANHSIQVNYALDTIPCLPVNSNTNLHVCSSQVPYNWNGTIMTISGSGGTNTTPLHTSCGADSTAFVYFIIDPDFTITATAGTGGIISPTGATAVCQNTTQTYTFSPQSASYILDSVLVDGVYVGKVSSYTFNNVMNNHSIRVVYEYICTPNASNTSASICSGDSYIFGSNNYNTAGTYQVHLTNVGGCDSLATLNLTVNEPTNSTTSANICVTELPYNWNGVNYNSGGSYTIHLTNSVGCDSAATLNLTANPMYLIDASASTNGSISNNGGVGVCPGSNSNMYVITANAGYHIADVLIDGISVGAITSYRFFNVNANHTIRAIFALSCSPSTSSTSYVTCGSYLWNGTTYTNSGSYTAHFTNSCGLDSAATLNLTIKTATSSTSYISVCSNQLPYVWNGSTFAAAGNYTVHLTNAAGCDSSAFLVLGVSISSPSSIVISSTATTICSGTSVTFMATPGNGGTSPIYQWKRNGVNVCSNSSVYSSSSLANGDSIWCELSSNSTCATNAIAESNSVKMIVNRSPSMLPITKDAISNAIAATTMCSLGTTTRYYDNTPYGTWSSNNPSVASVSSTGSGGNVTANANGTATISYSIAATNGCVSSSTLLVTVAQQPAPTAIIGNNSICVDATTALNTAAPSGTTGVWSSSNDRGTIDASGIYTGRNAGTWGEARYMVTNTTTGCTAYAAYAITVNATPNVPTIGYAPGTPNLQGSGGYCTNKTFTVVGTPTGGVWSKTGVINVTTPGGVVTTGSVAGSGTLKYTYTSAAGCSNSRTMVGNIVTCAARGINTVDGQLSTVSDFTMYPNPAKGFVNLNVETLVGSGNIAVADVYGKVVKTQNLSMGTNTVNIANLSKGLYLVSVIANEGKSTKKLIVE